MSNRVMGYRNFYKLQDMFDLIRHNNRTFFSRKVTILEKRRSPETTIGRYGYSMQSQGLRLFSSKRKMWTTFASNRDVVEDDKKKGSSPIQDSPWRFIPSWVRWLFGSILTVLPFFSEKWAKLRSIEGKAEMVVEEVENVAEIVEKAAKTAEKVSSDVADMLPQNTKLKETALFVERVSKQAAQDAHLAINFIHKVDELKHELVDIEMIEEVVKDKHRESERK